MGVIQDGYYYPGLEEIHIGYECQINDALGYTVEYKPTVIEFKEKDGTYTNEIADVIHMMDDRYGEVRVELLSDEDLIKTGWVFRASVWEGPTTSEGRWFLKRGEGNNISLQCMPTDYGITRYKGPCPTINELKYLMRLLKIENGKME